MRRLLAAMATLSVLFASVASAQTGPGVDAFDSSTIGVVDSTPAAAGQTPQGGVASGATAGPVVYRYLAIGWGAVGGGMCVGTYYTTDPTTFAAYQANTVQSLVAAAAANGFTITACPATAAAPPDPGTLARDFYTVRVLPSPTLKVVPDYGIVGTKVYLQIGGDNAKRFDVADPLGAPIAIDATSTYHVNWGDGSSTDTSSHGGPYPDGDVTHVYTHDASAITIRVTQGWTATWKSGAAGGTLPPLSTSGDLPFRVEQVQAVGG